MGRGNCLDLLNKFIVEGHCLSWGLFNEFCTHFFLQISTSDIMIVCLYCHSW